MTFDEFVKKYNGTKTDYDNVSGVQCVDLAKLYLDKVFGIKAGAWGNAKDYWTSFEKRDALVKNFTKIKNTPDLIPQKGDIIVWSGDISFSNDYGHIAIATGEGTTSYFYSYDQNWNGKEMKKIKHTYYAVYGVLRPKDKGSIAAAPKVKNGVYSLTNVRGVYNGAGAKTGRKQVADLTADGQKYAVSKVKSDAAYLKANTKVTVLETKLISSGNLWARIPSGWICVWEKDKDKLFVKKISA
ncbi:MAG: CHAP domain-containing protein [Eubacteriales bacterium]|nr:CHAP domain-containing protein [Eubacteriales bacterium]